MQNRHPDEKTVTLNSFQGLSNPTIHLPQIPGHARNDRYHTKVRLPHQRRPGRQTKNRHTNGKPSP